MGQVCELYSCDQTQGDYNTRSNSRVRFSNKDRSAAGEGLRVEAVVIGPRETANRPQMRLFDLYVKNKNRPWFRSVN